MDKNYNCILSEEEVIKILNRDLGHAHFNILRSQVTPFSENPTGFLGIHYKMIVEFEVLETHMTKEYFVKKIPEDVASHNWYTKTTGIYFKEIEFYETVVRDVQLNMTPGRTLTKWSPRLLFSRKERELLVLEDLSVQGYYMVPEQTEFDLNQLKMCMKALAAMHAGPMMMTQMLADNKARHFPKGWSPGEMTELPSLYPHIAYECEASSDPTHPGNKFYEAGFKAAVAVVDLLPGYTPEQRQAIKSTLPNVLRRMFLFVLPSKIFRNTWVHGDLWANNVMFRNNGDNLEAVIIDFQLARMCPPALDVIMLIHQVQSKSFRNDHLVELLDTYYQAFTQEVQTEGYSAQLILPRKEFDESCSYFYEFSLLSQVMFYQLTLAPPEVVGKFLSSPQLFDLNMLTDRSEMVVESFTTNEITRRRMTEVLNEVIDYFKLAQL